MGNPGLLVRLPYTQTEKSRLFWVGPESPRDWKRLEKDFFKSCLPV